MNPTLMKIVLNNDKSIAILQKDFNTTYPYLKLELFTNAMFNSSTKVRGPIQTNKKLGDYRRILNSSFFEITPNLTVAELIQNCSEIYGLEALVLRKSGKAWLGTGLTENWTLEEQNRQGEILST